MNLVETSTIPVFDLPVQAFREHLRTASGFGDESLQEGVLEVMLRAALAAIEARTGKALLARGFRWIVSAWRSDHEQALPIAPVSEVTSLTLVGRDGDLAPYDMNCVHLVRDSQRPLLRGNCHRLPRIPTGGTAQITFTAGFADQRENLPSDLQLAVLILAAYFYENRGDSAARDGNMPLTVTSLIERYRTVRIIGGAQA
ncbi:MAG: head-tail connector protein [Paracoccaceae bacterium]